jgi:propionyl-CoA carboxylase alpha chain
VFRTCRDLGVETVAVFSDPDVESAHVAEADLACRLPGAAPAETYLRGDLIVAAAVRSGADAIHPGYGFLSENAGFASDVINAGLTWVGPPAEAIAAIGSKSIAKELVSGAGVPVLDSLRPDRLTAADFPVLVKASAGGGGRGMRVVNDPDKLTEAIAGAAREAGSAFGDDTVFLERYLERARHIEIQVMADMHGTVWTLGERECSIQRRHQKIIEEAPSPAVTPELRARLSDAAEAAVRTVGYVGAGTVEFMVTETGEFYFLEVNTRLQVEHPVTECVYGLDLVALQLEIAEGSALPAVPPTPRGHAIEARLYAEDPSQDWRPNSGRMYLFDVPGVDAEFKIPSESYGLRLDSGISGPVDISVHYDPMLAKVIALAPTRSGALRRLSTGLASARIHGPGTNRDLLVRVLRHPEFLTGQTDTHFLDRNNLCALNEPLTVQASTVSAASAAVVDMARNRARATVLQGIPAGWRNVRSQPQQKSFVGPEGRIDVSYHYDRDRFVVEDNPQLLLMDFNQQEVIWAIDDVVQRFAVTEYGGEVVFVDSAYGEILLRPLPLLPLPEQYVPPGSLSAAISGVVTRVLVDLGDEVQIGDPLLVVEAMKMEHTVASPSVGLVREIRTRVGAQVQAGDMLVVITADGDEVSSE